MFRNLKLSTKLAIGFALVLVLSTVVSVVAIVYMEQISNTTTLMYDHPYTVHTEILRARGNIIAMSKEMETGNVGMDEAKIEKIDRLEGEVFESFIVLYNSFRGDPDILDDALNAFMDWKPIRDEIIGLQQEWRLTQATKVALEKGEPQVELINERIETIVGFAQQSAENFRDSSITDANVARRIVIGLLIGAYVLTILVAYIVIRGLTRPIARLVPFAGEIAQGNLAVKEIDYAGKDEVGALTQALNQMKVGLGNMANSVLQSVELVNSASRQMSTATQETSAAVEELASSANQFAGTAEDLSSEAQAMSSLVTRTNELSEKGADEITKTVETMAEITEVVTTLALNIKDLGRQSEEIGQIVTLITGIADQTNLLALNAAIEAARAGDQGRGFAVVADEVRKLAEQSSMAAGEITHLVDQILASANNSVELAETGTNKVREGTEVVAASGEMFGEITSVIDTLVQQITKVATASQELAAGAQQMGATTEEQSAVVQQMAVLAQEVVEAANAVSEEMARFKVN